MNDKETVLDKVIDVVYDCCVTIVRGKPNFTRGDILGKNRSENLIMTRCILVSQIVSMGYTKDTIKVLLNRDVHSIRHLLELDIQFERTSYAYRVAKADATIKCKELMRDI